MLSTLALLCFRRALFRDYVALEIMLTLKMSCHFSYYFYPVSM
jgi:hypothetical protein